MSDTRWHTALLGLRVFLYEPMHGIDFPAEGEVTGYSHSGCFVWVVWDGHDEPHQMRWHEVRPA